MFILRNKETKKFPFGFEERDFPLTTGENLKESLYGYYYGNQKALEKYFIPKEPDPYSDNSNYFDPEKYEIVEFEMPEPFYAREAVGGRRFEIIDGYGKIFFNTNLGMEPVQDEYGESLLFDPKTGEPLEIPAYQQYFILELIHGRASISWYANTEEGHSYTDEYIELVYNDEGFPYWAITNESGGSDCDGPIERTNHYISHGGFNSRQQMITNFGKEYTEEKYERELRWHSPSSSNLNKRGSQRDYFAEQAGY